MAGFSFYHAPLSTTAYEPASRSSSESHGKVTHLEGEVERLLIITEALWKILQEVTGDADERLIEEMARIDLKDGVLDGRVRDKEPPTKCRKCKRAVAKNRQICIYCGSIVVQKPFAR